MQGDIAAAGWPPAAQQAHACRTLQAHPALQRALDIIERRLGDKLSLQDIADAACMSRFHLARLFRLRLGCSPMRYLQRSRLVRAQRLLREGALPICAIAAATGFADQSHLTRALRRATGLTPRRYARQHATGEPAAHAAHGQGKPAFTGRQRASQQ
jgi:transcriptional regulator GlxA family with amidase domain